MQSLRARQLLARVLDSPGGMKIQTIHSFCQSLLARFPLEAGVAPHFHLIEEQGAAERLAAARDTVLAASGLPGGEGLAEAVERISPLAAEQDFTDLLPGMAAYCASKAALAMVTRSVHHELADAGVYSYGFIPGVVDTDMQATIRASGVNEVSRLRREELAPAQKPARLVALLCLGRPAEFRGQDVSVRDEAAIERIEAALRAAMP